MEAVVCKFQSTSFFLSQMTVMSQYTRETILIYTGLLELLRNMILRPPPKKYNPKYSIKKKKNHRQPRSRKKHSKRKKVGVYCRRLLWILRLPNPKLGRVLKDIYLLSGTFLATLLNSIEVQVSKKEKLVKYTDFM